MYSPIKATALCPRSQIPFHGARPWRMNLLQSSRQLQPTTLFLAVHNEVHVYTSQQSAHLAVDRASFVQSTRRLSLTDAGNHGLSDQEHRTINAIHIGQLGQHEVLVAVDELGGVTVWFTRDLEQPPMRFNVQTSAWGIATQASQCLLAVSTNAHEISVWDLRDRFIQPIAAKAGQASVHRDQEHDAPCPLGHGQLSRILTGHTHNVPCIDISPCGRWLVSCSIDSTCRVWRLQDGQCVMQRSFPASWGWSVHFTQPVDYKMAPGNSIPDSVSDRTRYESMLDRMISRAWGEQDMDLPYHYRHHFHELLGERGSIRSFATYDEEDDSGEALSEEEEEAVAAAEEESEEVEVEVDTGAEDMDVVDIGPTPIRATSPSDGMAITATPDDMAMDVAATSSTADSAAATTEDPRWPRNTWSMARYTSEDARASYWSPGRIQPDEPSAHPHTTPHYSPTRPPTESMSTAEQPTNGSLDSASGSRVAVDEDEEDERMVELGYAEDIDSSDDPMYSYQSGYDTHLGELNDNDYDDDEEEYDWDDETNYALPWQVPAQHHPLYRSPLEDAMVRDTTGEEEPLEVLQWPLADTTAQTSVSQLSGYYAPSSSGYSARSSLLFRDPEEMSDGVNTTAATIYSEDRATLIGTDDGESQPAGEGDELAIVPYSVGIGMRHASTRPSATAALARPATRSSIANHEETRPGSLAASASAASHAASALERRRLERRSYTTLNDAATTTEDRPVCTQSPQLLLLMTTGVDVFLLDAGLETLPILDARLSMLANADRRMSQLLDPFDRMNMVEWIPELSLAVIASQKGMVALTRLIRAPHSTRYTLYLESTLPAMSDLPPVPLLGMAVVRRPTAVTSVQTGTGVKVPLGEALVSYWLYLAYYDETLLVYELRRALNAAHPVTCATRLL